MENVISLSFFLSFFLLVFEISQQIILLHATALVVPHAESQAEQRFWSGVPTPEQMRGLIPLENVTKVNEFVPATSPLPQGR